MIVNSQSLDTGVFDDSAPYPNNPLDQDRAKHDKESGHAAEDSWLAGIQEDTADV